LDSSDGTSLALITCMNLRRNKISGHLIGQLEGPSMSCRKALANRGFLAGGFIATAAIIVAFAILTTAAPAFAQSSLDSSSAPATDYLLPPPEGGSLAVPATPDDATPSDATSSAAMPTKPSAAVKPVTAADIGSTSAAAHSGWDRVGDVYTDTDNEDQADKVLEVPPVLPPDNPRPSDDADQTAQEGGSQSPDQVGSIQVGSIEDYQEEDAALMGAYGVPVLLGPVGINPFRVSAFHAPLNPGEGFRPSFRPGLVPIVPRPFGGGMNSAILPTSPMFPSGSARFSGGMPFSRGMGFPGGMRGGRR
jgi:hypothetical protein